MGSNYFMGDNKPTPEKRTEILSAEAPVSKMRKAGNKVAMWLVNNHTGLLSIVLFAFALLVMVTENLNLEGIFWQKVVSPETLLLASCSYTLYINAYIMGSNVASKTDFVINIETAYAEEIRKIRAKRIEWMLELFSSDYRMRELKYARTEILICAGFTESAVADILAGKTINQDTLTEDQKKALAKAQALKPIKLNKQMLVNAHNEQIDRSPIRSASAIEFEKYRAFVVKLITIVISFTFVVSLSIQLKTDFSLSTIVYTLFQLALMLVSLFTGMSLGHKIKIKYTERIQDIVGVLYEFLEWYEYREKHPNTSENELQGR